MSGLKTGGALLIVSVQKLINRADLQTAVNVEDRRV